MTEVVDFIHNYFVQGYEEELLSHMEASHERFYGKSLYRAIGASKDCGLDLHPGEATWALLGTNNMCAYWGDLSKVYKITPARELIAKDYIATFVKQGKKGAIKVAFETSTESGKPVAVTTIKYMTNKSGYADAAKASEMSETGNVPKTKVFNTPESVKVAPEPKTSMPVTPPGSPAVKTWVKPTASDFIPDMPLDGALAKYASAIEAMKKKARELEQEVALIGAMKAMKAKIGAMEEKKNSMMSDIKDVITLLEPSAPSPHLRCETPASVVDSIVSDFEASNEKWADRV
jgi:hypothetical protein